MRITSRVALFHAIDCGDGKGVISELNWFGGMEIGIPAPRTRTDLDMFERALLESSLNKKTRRLLESILEAYKTAGD